jgi:hypothetical protein
MLVMFGDRWSCVDDPEQKQARGSISIPLETGNTHGMKSTDVDEEFGMVTNFTATSII